MLHLTSLSSKRNNLDLDYYYANGKPDCSIQLDFKNLTDNKNAMYSVVNKDNLIKYNVKNNFNSNNNSSDINSNNRIKNNFFSDLVLSSEKKLSSNTNHSNILNFIYNPNKMHNNINSNNNPHLNYLDEKFNKSNSCISRNSIESNFQSNISYVFPNIQMNMNSCMSVSNKSSIYNIFNDLSHSFNSRDIKKHIDTHDAVIQNNKDFNINNISLEERMERLSPQNCYHTSDSDTNSKNSKMNSLDILKFPIIQSSKKSTELLYKDCLANSSDMEFNYENSKSAFKKLINFNIEKQIYKEINYNFKNNLPEATVLSTGIENGGYFNYLTSYAKNSSIFNNLSNRKNKAKKIPKTPYKVLDAPLLRDDFYLHLLDWSEKDLLAVGLEKSIYIWEGKSSNVLNLHDYPTDLITSVKWIKNNEFLAIALDSGKIDIWDVEATKIIHSYNYHNDRIGVIAPMHGNNPNIFSSGSQDKVIVNYDFREDNYIGKYIGHTQEICGLKWSPDDRLLASGGNDNKLFIWNANKTISNYYKNSNFNFDYDINNFFVNNNNNNVSNYYIQDPNDSEGERKFLYEKKINAHSSAIKAIDWSPHKFGFLLTGGGTQDRTIKLWNTQTMKLIESIDTSSQVCNIAFSKNSHEFVSSHGYSENLILVWDSDTMEVKASLKGHKDRVIYLSVGADGEKIVTGAGDETIRFWDVFENDNNKDKETNKNKSCLDMKNFCLR